jgi:hypothetical protein
LEVAALLGEYSLVDKGTWWSVEPWIREKLMTFVNLPAEILPDNGATTDFNVCLEIWKR